MTDIQGVVFDMDGLLLDSERLYFEAFRETRAALGLLPDDALFLSMVGTNFTLGRRILANGLGDSISLGEFEAHWDKRCAARVAEGVPVKSGVTPLLTALRESGVPFAIATSTHTDKAWVHLEDAGLHHHFDVLIGGDQVNQSKPAPDIYLKACATLDLPPARCAAFEDSENGVRAAHAAGMITVQIPDLKQPGADLLALGHVVSSDLMSGAHAIGLFSEHKPRA